MARLAAPLMKLVFLLHANPCNARSSRIYHCVADNIPCLHTIPAHTCHMAIMGRARGGVGHALVTGLDLLGVVVITLLIVPTQG
jgi:hypothetical protein